MDKNIILDTVVPSTSLEDKEGYAVGSDGVLTAATGVWAAGIVYEGRPADEASVIVSKGRTKAYVDGTASAVAVDDPLTASAGGVLVKATIGTHEIRAHAKEATSALTTIEIDLL